MLLVCTNMPKIAVHRSSKSQNFQWHASCRGVGALAASKNWELAESADSGNIVGPILSDLCAMCLQACCRGPASASSILPQTLSDSQTDFAQLQELRKVICHERQTGARRGDCCLALGRLVSGYQYQHLYTTLYDIIRHISSTVLLFQQGCTACPSTTFPSIIFHHLPSSHIILHHLIIFSYLFYVLYPYSCNCDSQSANHHDKSIVHIQPLQSSSCIQMADKFEKAFNAALHWRCRNFQAPPYLQNFTRKTFQQENLAVKKHEANHNANDPQASEMWMAIYQLSSTREEFCLWDSHCSSNSSNFYS